MNAEDTRSYCRYLTSAFSAMSSICRVVLMKHMIERGPVTLDQAVAVVGDTLDVAPSRKSVMVDLRAMVGAGLVRHVIDEVGQVDTWRAAQSCVSNAIRRAMCPKRTVFTLTRGKAYDFIGAYATRGGADAAKEDFDRMEEERIRQLSTGSDFRAMHIDTEIEEIDVGV